MWARGTIDFETEDGRNTVVRYSVEHFDEPSIWGYRKGKASRIWLKQDSRVVYNFDRGEDVKPQTEEAKESLKLLLKKYN